MNGAQQVRKSVCEGPAGCCETTQLGHELRGKYATRLVTHTVKFISEFLIYMIHRLLVSENPRWGTETTEVSGHQPADNSSIMPSHTYNAMVFHVLVNFLENASLVVIYKLVRPGCSMLIDRLLRAALRTTTS